MADYQSEIAAQLERAETSLQAAKELLEKEYHDIAASRAYYAAFYASSALLLSAGIDPSKHSGVIAAIHREFVKTGKLDKEQGKNLNWLFELRSVGDYGVIVHVSVGESMRAVKVAQEYFQAIKQLLR
jgi:uncharacterized protein (UPF0332 family)